MRFLTTQSDLDKVNSAKTQMALAFARLGRPFYEGTVPASTIAKRRAANRVARRSRRANRR